MFIAIEGNDGSGKTTLVSKLREIFTDAVFTREPGGTPNAEAIRHLILTTEYPKRSALTQTLLFQAARVDHLENVIKPAVAEGKMVICDRYVDSTYAYQVNGSGLDEEVFNKLVDATLGGFKPDITIYLLCPVSIALQRLAVRGGMDQDVFESENGEFHQKVFSGYLKRAKENRDVCFIIDGSKPVTHVFEDVMRALRTALSLYDLVHETTHGLKLA